MPVQTIDNTRIEMIPLQSSRIKSVAFTPQGLLVEFPNGHRYGYSGVPRQTFDKLVNAPSPGSMLNMIQKRFRYKRIS